MKSFLLTFLFLPFLLTNIYAAPAPRYIAVNEELNLCGEYWPGDEFGQNEIPNGWEIVDEENFSPEACSDLEYSNFNQECCELIGYEYVDDIYTYNSEDEKKNDILIEKIMESSEITWITGASIALIAITLLVLIKKKIIKM